MLEKKVSELEREAAELRRSVHLLRESKQKYRDLAEGTNDIVYSLDAEGMLTYVGPQVTRYGLLQEEITSRHFSEFLLLADRGSTVFDFYKTITTGAEFPTEFRVADGKGRFVWFEDYGKVQRDTSGKITGITGVLRDVTDRKLAEEALRESEERLRQMCRLSPFPIAIIEADGRHSYLNEKFADIFGYDLQDIPTEKEWFFKAFPNEKYRRHVLSTWKSDLAELGERNAGEFKVMCKDGTVKDILFRPVYLSEGTRLVACEDLTESRRAETERAKLFTEVKKGRDDLLSILNMLELGIVTVDEDGRITFVNVTAQELLGMNKDAILGQRWEELFDLNPQGKVQLADMWQRSAKDREKVQVQVEVRKGRTYWMDVEVQDDPRNPKRRMLFFYDMSELYDLRRKLEGKASFHDIVGRSKAMQAIYQQIQDVSGVDWTVLIEGETGTGKELVARAIHYSGHRKDGPFITVNCAGLDDPLLTSQLFGHKRGAFTGAIEDHKGFFEVANGGTLLLDEIGDISKNMQTRLLRVLEEKKITRLGESTPRDIDARVLVSTHRDLTEEVERGNFRPDLLYRIRVARLWLPPLRERREDIRLLVDAFLSESRAATGKRVRGVSKEALRILLQHTWPGNVRELKSAIDFATLYARGSIITPEDLPPEIVYPKPIQPANGRPYQSERERILAALASAGWNRSVAARLLGMSRSTLYRRMEKFDIKPAE